MKEKSNNLISISGKKNSGKDTVGAILQYLIWKDDVEKGTHKSLNWTLQDFLDGRAIYKYKIKRFADPIKDYVCILLGCTREQLEDRDFKEKELGEEWWYYKYKDLTVAYKEEINNFPYELAILVKHTPRSLMQIIGTEAGREIIHPNMFINALFSKYKNRKPQINLEPFDLLKLYYHESCYNCKKSYQGGKRQWLCDECIVDDTIKYYPNWIIPDLRFPNEARATQKRNGLLIRVERPGLIENNHESEIALDNYREWDEVIVNNGTISELVEKVEEILIRRKIIWK